MPSDTPDYTGEPGAEPEYAPGEPGPDVTPGAPEELPDPSPFGDDGGTIEIPPTPVPGAAL